MADIRLAKPVAGTTQTVPSAPDGRFIFDFPADAATLTRNGDDLVLTFEDGSSIQLQGFYTTYSKEEMPSFQVEGVEISGQDFFAALGEDLMPAAGPAAGSSASRGGRYNEYGGSDLLDGIDHLGRLDIGFDGATQLATDTVEPSAPEVDIDYDVTIAAGPEAGPVDLTVYEGGLAGGSQAGQAGTPTTASGSLNINAPDGVASIVIGGVVVFENGKMTGNVVTTDEGTLAVTGYDPATGKLDFSYTLDRNTTEHDKSDPATDTQISHDLTVTVTDTDGDSASTTITVNVVDDAPTVGSFSHEMSEGDAIPVVGNALSGAVAGADGAKFAWDANQNGHFGTITLNADGTYSYRLDNDNATVKELTDGETLTEEFTYTYTDADGDIAEGKVTITINGKDNGIIIEPTDPAAGSDKVTVYESGLADGSQAGQDDAPTTASGSLIITAPDGVASIVIGGVVVFKNGALTGNAVPTDEGALTVTGFDPVTGELKFTYALSGNTTEHSGSGMDDISHDLTVTVTDTDGTEVDSTITVNVVDDVPSISAEGVTVTEGGEASAAITPSYGADVPAGSTVTVKNGTYQESGDHAGSYEVANGWVTISADGKSYTFEAKPDIAPSVTSENITFEITDADGDKSTTEVTVNLEQAQGPGQQTAIVVDEAALDSVGSKPGSDAEHAVVRVDGYTIIEGGTGAHGTITQVDGQWVYTLTSPVQGPVQDDGAQLTGSDTVTIMVQDEHGNTFEVEIPVDIRDDVPSITASDMSSMVIPGSGAGNLENGEKATFTDKNDAGHIIAQGSKLDGWDGVAMYAGKVTYTTDAVGNTIIREDGLDTPAGYQLQYSTYPTEEKPSSDWGLMVSSPDDAQAWEINVSKNGQTSEAVIFDLDGQLAYGVTIDFGAFYNGKPGAEGTTQWDHVSEKALVTFYRDGEIVGSTIVEGNSSTGTFTLNSSDVILGGFDKVVISAVDNRTDEYRDEHSDFTIQGIDFITKRDDPFIVSEGKVTAASGADGFADAYTDIHARFDLAGMVNEGTLSADGTSGIITVLVDGQQTDVTLTLNEGASGDSILTGTAANGEQLFTATLGKDGNWTMEQYDQFRVDNETETGSNQFELVFKTEDADGDVASTTVNVPLEVVDQTPATDTSIGNGDDTITITGGEGIAGTVAAGDSGGVEVQTTVQPGQDYNISIMLDLSGSMNDPSGSAGMSRLDMAKEALTTFINDTLAKHDGEINLQLITFNKTATEEDTWVLKSGTTEEIKNYNQAEIAKIVKTLNQIGKGGEGTNYEAAMEKATEWFSKDTAEDGVAGNGGENLAFFISDGQPTYYYGTDWWGNPKVEGEGNYSNQETVRQTLEAAQDLQNAGSGVQVNAIGIGTSKSLHEKAQTILDLIDNTGGSEQTQTEYPCQHQVQVGTGLLGTPKYEWQWTTGEWEESKPLILGDSDLVDSKDGLTAALVGGGTITSTELADAGGDKVDASDSTSSAIIYGDVMNTDRLLYELKQLELSNLVMAGAVVSALPGYGSGSEVFQWLEGNGDRLTGDYAGWTHDDTLKYMLEHAEELGYETRVDGNGEFYLVTADGTVLNMDGTEANVGLDSLTGRGGGNDTIIGSQADDVIYGQEGNDLLVGDAPSESGEGSTVGSIEGTTVASIKAMDTDGLDAFIQSVEGTDADGDDRLFGGTGDDVLLGMGGDDYIDGGAGEDAIFGGSGNDIIVYDSNDYLVSGGSGIDFMVSDNSTLTLTELLSGGKDGKDGPIVDSIEVLLKGDAALSLTSIQELADKYGITLGTNDAGQETLTLDMSKWTAQQDGSYDFKGDADLTLETNLQQDSGASSDSDGEMAQQVFILQNSNS